MRLLGGLCNRLNGGKTTSRDGKLARRDTTATIPCYSRGGESVVLRAVLEESEAGGCTGSTTRRSRVRMHWKKERLSPSRDFARLRQARSPEAFPSSSGLPRDQAGRPLPHARIHTCPNQQHAPVFRLLVPASPSQLLAEHPSRPSVLFCQWSMPHTLCTLRTYLCNPSSGSRPRSPCRAMRSACDQFTCPLDAAPTFASPASPGTRSGPQGGCAHV